MQIIHETGGMEKKRLGSFFFSSYFLKISFFFTIILFLFIYKPNRCNESILTIQSRSRDFRKISNSAVDGSHAPPRY